jgi:precorrin-6B methylase 2
MDAATVYASERLVMAMDALMNAYDHIVIDVGAVANAPTERIARIAPCGLLVAGAMSEADADMTRERLLKAGFGDIAVYTGTPPALDDESVGNVAA